MRRVRIAACSVATVISPRTRLLVHHQRGHRSSARVGLRHVRSGGATLVVPTSRRAGLTVVDARPLVLAAGLAVVDPRHIRLAAGPRARVARPTVVATRNLTFRKRREPRVRRLLLHYSLLSRAAQFDFVVFLSLLSVVKPKRVITPDSLTNRAAQLGEISALRHDDEVVVINLLIVPQLIAGRVVVLIIGGHLVMIGFSNLIWKEEVESGK